MYTPHKSFTSVATVRVKTSPVSDDDVSPVLLRIRNVTFLDWHQFTVMNCHDLKLATWQYMPGSLA